MLSNINLAARYIYKFFISIIKELISLWSSFGKPAYDFRNS